MNIARTLIHDEVRQAAARLNLDVSDVDQAQSRLIRDELLRRYGADQRYELTPANLRDKSSVQHPDSWRWLEEFLTTEPALIFYDCQGQSGMFLVQSGKDIVHLLAECFGFEFCVADKSASYLLCHNDHDYLIGVGAAKGWVESLQPRHDAWKLSLAAGASSSGETSRDP